MLTNDKNTQVLINEILTNKYELNLIKVVISKGDEILNGKGTVYQNEEGRLQLKFFSDKEYSEQERLRMLFENVGRNSEGGIYSEFYKMESTDDNRREYYCDQIDLNGSKDNVMIFRLLGSLNSSSNEGSSTRVILSGKYRIPNTGMINFKTSVSHDYSFTDNKNVWTIELNGNLKILITKYGNYLDLLILEQERLEFKDVDLIINSLDFVLGTESEPIFINISGNGHKVLNRRNMLRAASTFEPPLTSNHNYGSEFTINHSRLFILYYNFIFQDAKKKLPILHNRIVSGSRNYIYAAALVLSVQIETICKVYFSGYYKKDDEFISTLKKCKDLIYESQIENKESVIKILEEKIRVDTPNQINAKNIMQNLAKENQLTKSLISKWSSLRNITAHGDDYKDNNHKELIDKVFLCTNLYYQLIFSLIKYEGKYSWKEYGKNRLESYPLIPLEKSRP
jgi:hypothetical protein